MSDAMAAVVVTVLTGEPQAVELASMRLMERVIDLKDENVGVMTRSMDVKFTKEEGHE